MTDPWRRAVASTFSVGSPIPKQPGYEAAVRPTPTYLLAVLDSQSKLASVAVVSTPPGAVPSTILVVALESISEIEGSAPVALSLAYEQGGLDALTKAAESALGFGFADEFQLSSSGFAEMLPRRSPCSTRTRSTDRQRMGNGRSCTALGLFKFPPKRPPSSCRCSPKASPPTTASIVTPCSGRRSPRLSRGTWRSRGCCGLGGCCGARKDRPACLGIGDAPAQTATSLAGANTSGGVNIGLVPGGQRQPRCQPPRANRVLGPLLRPEYRSYPGSKNGSTSEEDDSAAQEALASAFDGELRSEAVPLTEIPLPTPSWGNRCRSTESTKPHSTRCCRR